MNDAVQDKFICPLQGAPRAGLPWISPARAHPNPQQVSRADLEMLPGPTNSPGKFMMMRQVQDQAMKSIHRSVDSLSMAVRDLDTGTPTTHFWQGLAEMI